MLARLFRRPHRPALPTSSAELAEALRTAAHFADTDDARIEYTTAADALDRAIHHTRAHGDEPTRDALAYALGRAELNLKDQLSELIEVSKDTHLLVQTVHTAQGEQGAAVAGLRAEFQEFGEDISGRITDLEDWRTEAEKTFDGFRESHDQSREQRTRTENAVADLARQFTAFTQHIDTLIAQGPTPEQAQNYRAFLDQLMAEREAGG